MNKEAIVQSIVLNLQNIDFGNKDIAIRQLASAVDLLESIALDINSGQVGANLEKCHHPKEALIDLTTLGSAKKKYQCTDCGEQFEE
jgi:hypothetical protein